MTRPGWEPSATPATLRRRAGLLSAARAYFTRAGVLEVETPQLSHFASTDPQLASLRAEVAGQGRMYLHTSPEFAMKRLLAAGIGDCYQVCHAFRDGERGRHHNPEFTMIEWYRLGFNAAQLMDDVEALLSCMLAGERPLPAARRLRYREAVQRHGGVDPMAATEAELTSALERHGVRAPAAAGGERDALLDLLVSAVVAPRLGRGAPEFIHGYPASQAALARITPGDPALAERFELYFEGIELANGFHELGDASEQRRRFAADAAAREALGRPPHAADERLLAALEHGLPDCAGVALGFDRLVMVAVGLESIDEAMAFAVERA